MDVSGHKRDTLKEFGRKKFVDGVIVVAVVPIGESDKILSIFHPQYSPFSHFHFTCLLEFQFLKSGGVTLFRSSKFPVEFPV